MTRAARQSRAGQGPGGRGRAGGAGAGAGAGAATPALTALAAAGVEHTVRAYQHDPDARDGGGYGLEAATALGVDPATVFKTLVAEVDGRLTVAVVPVTAQLDLKALAAAVAGRRAAMADPALAQRSTGYVVGGISPLGQRRRLATVIDTSALDRASILISAGRRGLDVELHPSDLITLTGAVVARIGRSRG